MDLSGAHRNQSRPGAGGGTARVAHGGHNRRRALVALAIARIVGVVRTSRAPVAVLLVLRACALGQYLPAAARRPGDGRLRRGPRLAVEGRAARRRSCHAGDPARPSDGVVPRRTARRAHGALQLARALAPQDHPGRNRRRAADCRLALLDVPHRPSAGTGHAVRNRWLAVSAIRRSPAGRRRARGTSMDPTRSAVRSSPRQPGSRR